MVAMLQWILHFVHQKLVVAHNIRDTLKCRTATNKPDILTSLGVIKVPMVSISGIPSTPLWKVPVLE